ncbi:hypothetical protein TNIN_113521 [Trichonephila inaurata madagascariensis]|uniref:Uncharacterized protein n=1 Tax=Trichonephila inaurata madagascariensis TaxID=2747483 RepID=A0A8X6XJV9_9ARAC|nr:hypothetical protein TNIN_113521 [Trichonephila inaurata madagascariensis]
MVLTQVSQDLEELYDYPHPQSRKSCNQLQKLSTHFTNLHPLQTHGAHYTHKINAVNYKEQCFAFLPNRIQSQAQYQRPALLPLPVRGRWFSRKVA